MTGPRSAARSRESTHEDSRRCICDSARRSALREARIDLGAVRSNLGVLRELTAPALTMAVVKANAYGHGALGVAQAVVDAGADWLGVADLDEALALRSAGIDAPMLAWLHGAETDFAPAVEAGIDLGISSLAQLERAAASGDGVVVQLKVNTGLSRNGFEGGDAPAAFVRAAELESEGRLRVRGIFSHLSNTSRADDDAQLAEFTEPARRRAAPPGSPPSCGTSPRPRPRSRAPTCDSTWCASASASTGCPPPTGSASPRWASAP